MFNGNEKGLEENRFHAPRSPHVHRARRCPLSNLCRGNGLRYFLKTPNSIPSFQNVMRSNSKTHRTEYQGAGYSGGSPSGPSAPYVLVQPQHVVRKRCHDFN